MLVSLIDQKPAPNGAHFYTWILALILELLHFSFKLAHYSREHSEAGLYTHRKRHTGLDKWELTEVAIDLVRIVFLVSLLAFYVVFVTLPARRSKSIETGSSSETTSLLGAEHREAENGNGHGNGHANGGGGYGSTAPVGGKHQHTEGAPPGWVRPMHAPSRSWWEYIKGYHVFFPYLWPSKDRRLQIMVVFCFVLVILQRIVNVLAPHQFGKIVNELAGENGTDGDGGIHTPWKGIVFYIALRFLQGNNGILGAIRSTLWIPVSQYSYRELSVAAFEHVHGLSLDFHLGKKTGEVLSALGKGSSINTFLEQVTFQVLPMLFDLAVAIGYFMYAFDEYYALVLCIVTFWYIYITIRMAQWRAEIRREMVNADREEDAVK